LRACSRSFWGQRKSELSGSKGELVPFALRQPFQPLHPLLVRFVPALLLLCSLGQPLLGQGVLTVTPGRTIATTAGTGKAGYGGDGSQATSAQLARPSGLAYDAAGNLFLADANNHVVREITPAGTITTVAGSGVAGFGGDGGVATAAFLDTPTAVALDRNGTLYIADSHNHRIRMVKQGVITTVAGTGVSGFSGDGGAALSAQLALPTGLALDASGNLYIADTNNQRVRKVSNGTISTVAGNGEELFAGDGSPATQASLDQPTGVAVDASGTLYIADKNNHRLRTVSPAGIISTLAGNGIAPFSGAFAGDGAAANGAALAKPVSVSLDAAGNIYVADTNNQRIRQINASGVITTLAGTGDQGFAGDGGPAASAVLNSPRAAVTDALGNLSITDTRNQRLRSANPGSLSFGTQPVGVTSVPQPITLANSGTAPLSVAALSFSGPYQTAAGGTCSALPFTLSPGQSCTEDIAFTPTAAGYATGSVSFSGPQIGGQNVLLNGTGAGSSTTLLLAANKPALLAGESVTLTATLNTSTGVATGAPGSVSFYAGSALLGSANLVQGKAQVSTSNLSDGTQTLTAVYSGAGGFSASTSGPLTEAVADLSLALNALQTTTIVPGHSAPVPLSITTSGVSGLSGNVVFSASSLPAGMSVTFAPGTAALVNGLLPITMNVTAPPAGPVSTVLTAEWTGSGAFLAFLLFPSYRKRMRLQGSVLRSLTPFLLLLGGVLGLGALTGCGSNTGFFGQKQQTYNFTVSATATDSTGGSLTRNTGVTVIVQ
jgi:sugar lactone lactonase YvrE